MGDLQVPFESGPPQVCVNTGEELSGQGGDPGTSVQDAVSDEPGLPAEEIQSTESRTILNRLSGRFNWSKSSRIADTGHLVVHNRAEDRLGTVVKERILAVCSQSVPDGVVCYHARSGTRSEHFHIVHPCRGRSKYCKCHFRQTLNGISPSIRVKGLGKRKFRGGFHRRRLGRLLEYLRRDDRSLVQVNCEGKNELDKVLSTGSDSEEEDERFEKDLQEFLSSDREEGSSDDDSETMGETDEEPNRKRKNAPPEKSDGLHKGRYGKVFEALQEILERKRLRNGELAQDLEVQPILNRYNLLTSQAKDKIFAEVEKLVYTKWNQLPFLEKIKEQSKNPFAFKQKPRYYTLDYSYQLIMRLLLDQFKFTECVLEFIEVCKSWADFLIPKRNCLYIKGPPGCGKTYFMDTLVAIMWNVGRLGNLNKNQGVFFADDCINRSMISFEEGNLSNDANFVNDFKCLASGEDLIVNVKYQKGAVIRRTPLAVTCNTDIWILLSDVDRNAIKQRSNIYVWHALPWLSKCDGFPHPLVWQKLYQLCFNEDDLLACPLNDYFDDTKYPQYPPGSLQSKWLTGTNRVHLDMFDFTELNKNTGFINYICLFIDDVSGRQTEQRFL